MVKWLVDCCLMAILFTIFIEDIRSRQVHLYLFIVGFCLFFVKFCHSDADYISILINGCFICVQTLAIFLYIYLTKNDFRKIKEAIGVGDIFMWGLLIFGFSPINFILFFIASLFVSLFVYGLFMRKAVSKHIPLAGFQAIQFLILLLGQLFVHNYNLYSDDLIVNFVINGI